MTTTNVPSPTALNLFTFCFYIGKNTYHELVRMLFVLIASLDRFNPDFFLVVYHNLGITIDDTRDTRMVSGARFTGIGGPILRRRAENGGGEWGRIGIGIGIETSCACPVPLPCGHHRHHPPPSGSPAPILNRNPVLYR